jgi:hypothetical protein
VDCADCRAWRAPRFGNTLPVSAHEIAANRPSETCDAHHRWRTPSLEHNGRPRLANIGHCAKYGRHGVLCALIQPPFSGIKQDAGAISPLGSSREKRLRSGSRTVIPHRSLRQDEAPSDARSFALPQSEADVSDGWAAGGMGDCSGGPGRAGLTTLRGCIHRAKTAVLFQG